MAREVVLYTQPGWASCEREKEFLSQKGIAVTVKDIRADAEALAELQRLGYRATPVTLIDGETVVGFDRGRLERLLGLGWARVEVVMPSAWCHGWGQDIAIPAGIRSGEVFALHHNAVHGHLLARVDADKVALPDFRDRELDVGAVPDDAGRRIIRELSLHEESSLRERNITQGLPVPQTFLAPRAEFSVRMAMAVCCDPPAARLNGKSRTPLGRDDLRGAAAGASCSRVNPPAPIAEPSGPKADSHLLLQGLGFALVLVIILVINIILLGFASTRPVSTYPSGPAEPTPGWQTGGADGADGWTPPGRRCCQVVP